MRRAHPQPALESLEDRSLPATFGVPWPDPQHLTISFVPDGTSAGDGRKSDLFQLLDPRYGSPAVWEREILRAFQTWAQYANLNFGVVADGGEALGTPGAPQGDPRFGDIRIAAYPMSPEVLAVASPFDLLAGTYSGDVKLNANAPLGGPGGDDLYSVMLHEAGHTLGLGESTNPASPMYEDYLGVRSGLSAGDVASVQALYGVRAPDAFDAASPNDTLATASSLPRDPEGGSGALAADGDLTTRADVDWYHFKFSGGTPGATVTLHTAGVSLLAARLSVYDAAGNLVGAVDSSDTPGADLSIHLSGGKGGSDYYVKVEKSADDVFAVGGYHLTVTPDGSKGGSGGGTTKTPPGSGNAPVTNLQAKFYRSDGRFSYADQSSLAGGSTASFRFHTPLGAGDVMTVLVWSTQAGPFQPDLKLYDANGVAVHAQVLVAENGSYIIQIPAAAPDGAYVVTVGESDPAGVGGAFFLGIGFGSTPTALDTFTAGNAFARPDAFDSGTLHVSASQLFHFVLTAGPGAAGEAVSADVINAAGAEVAAFLAPEGGAATATVFLPPGDYSVSMTPVAGAGAFTPLSYSLQGLGLSNPIGPSPASVSSTPQADTGGPGGVGYWWQGGFSAFLTLSNPPATSGGGSTTGSGAGGGVTRAPGPTPGLTTPGVGGSSDSTSTTVRNAAFALAETRGSAAGTTPGALPPGFASVATAGPGVVTAFQNLSAIVGVSASGTGSGSAGLVGSAGGPAAIDPSAPRGAAPATDPGPILELRTGPDPVTSVGPTVGRVEKIAPDLAVSVSGAPSPVGADPAGTADLSFLTAPAPGVNDLPAVGSTPVEPGDSGTSWPRLLYATLAAGVGAVVFYPRKPRAR